MAELGFKQGFSDFERLGWAVTEFHFRNNRSQPGRSKHEVYRIWAKLNDRDLCLGDPEVESEVGGEKPQCSPGCEQMAAELQEGFASETRSSKFCTGARQGQHQTAGALGRRDQRVPAGWSMTDPVSDCLAC